MGGREAGPNSSEQLSISAGWLGPGTSPPTLQVPFLCPEDTLPLGQENAEAASSPPLLGGSPHPGLSWRLNIPVISHLIATVPGSQSHGAVARIAWENVRDVEMKAL